MTRMIRAHSDPAYGSASAALRYQAPSIGGDPPETNQRSTPLSRCLRGPFAPVAHVGLPPSPTLYASRPGYYSPSQAYMRLPRTIAPPPSSTQAVSGSTSLGRRPEKDDLTSSRPAKTPSLKFVILLTIYLMELRMSYRRVCSWYAKSHAISARATSSSPSRPATGGTSTSRVRVAVERVTGSR